MFIIGVSLIGILTKLFIAVDVIICIILIFVVLLQRPKSEGLGAAFGGDTASNIFGAQTTNVLSNLTRWLAGIFMVLTLALAILYSKSDDTRSATQVYIDNVRKKADEDKARKTAEDAAKAADAAKNMKPAAVTDPAAPAVSADDLKAMIEKGLKAQQSPAPATTPAAPSPTPAIAPPATPADPNAGGNPPPKPTESPVPAEATKAPEAAPAEAPKAPEPAKPEPAPAAPEPAKPAGN